MFFSVLLCVNKDNDYLDEAINSILNQSIKNFEFIIVANNCSDALFEKLSCYRSSHIKLYRTQIGQLAFNLNYGIDRSIGEYIVRMDSDDISLPDRLSILQKSIQENEFPDVIGGQALLIDIEGNHLTSFNVPLTNKKIRGSLWIKNPFIHPTVAIKKKALIENGGYLGGFNSEDYDLWLRLSRDPNIVFMNTDSCLLHYRINDGQCKGSRLAYSEVSGHLLKEAIYRKNIKLLIGSLISVVKVFIYAK